MARLVSWPQGLGVTDIRMLRGPRVVGGSESLEGLMQTVASPFGLRQFGVTFSPVQGVLARRHRGWIAQMHGGSNATRFKFSDLDIMSISDAGLTVSKQEFLGGVAWDNGVPWDSGEPWALSRPAVSVSVAAALNDTTISLESDYWGQSLGVGDMIGFYPSHFGIYFVTEVIAAGNYRIDLPLRKALATSDFCTMEPTIAVRLATPQSANAGRSLDAADGLAAEFVEVPHYDVVTYFSD